MKNEIRERIDAELPPGGTPVSIDADTVLRSSRTRRMKRRLLGGGAALASIAAVVALVLSVMTLAPGGDAKPDDAATDTKPDTDEPVLDPDKDYYWEGMFPAEKTDASRAYTNAFWEYMLAEHPEATFAKTSLQGDEHTPTEGDQSQLAHFMEGRDRLIEGTLEDGPDFDAEPVRERTVLNLYERDEPGDDSEETSCCSLKYEFDGDDGELDSLDLSVYPKGTYTKRTGDAMDLTTVTGPQDSTVVDVTGPGGLDIQNVTVSYKERAFQWSSVVYRADGSAVVVTLHSGATDDDSAEPNLDFEELRDIALALPTNTVG